MLKKFEDELAQLNQRYENLFIEVLQLHLTSARAREFAVHGFARRLKIITRCIRRVFEIIPPARSQLPTEHELSDAAIHVQAFIFNVFGCLDNLAWVWVSEIDLRKDDGTPLPASYVGLRPSNIVVRSSFSEETRGFLQDMNDWMGYLDDYRHALAHRIPLYIPPYTVRPENADAYNDLQKRMNEAVQKRRYAEYDALSAEQTKLAVFTPWIQHSIGEGTRPLVFHAQLLVDFSTVEQVAYKLIGELRRRA
jgi:hypothetical protein